jgi:hypothetical protein
LPYGAAISSAQYSAHISAIWSAFRSAIEPTHTAADMYSNDAAIIPTIYATQ